MHIHIYLVLYTYIVCKYKYIYIYKLCKEYVLFFFWGGTPSANPSRFLEERKGHGRFPETPQSQSCGQGDIESLLVLTDGLTSARTPWQKKVSLLVHLGLTSNNGGSNSEHLAEMARQATIMGMDIKQKQH